MEIQTSSPTYNIGKTILDPHIDDEAAVSQVIAEWANAIHNKDVDGIMSLLSPELVQFLSVAPLMSNASGGVEKRGIDAWFASFEGPIGYEIRDLRITASDEVAFAYSLNHIMGTKKDGSRQDMWMRDTLCFRKIKDQWKITHQHESVPFYTETQKVATDLKPERKKVPEGDRPSSESRLANGLFAGA